MALKIKTLSLKKNLDVLIKKKRVAPVLGGDISLPNLLSTLLLLLLFLGHLFGLHRVLGEAVATTTTTMKTTSTPMSTTMTIQIVMTTIGSTTTTTVSVN